MSNSRPLSGSSPVIKDSEVPPPADRPDILLILTDQWNPRMLGCGEDPHVQTPNIDGLAQAGVRFSNAYTSSPVCMAARCSLVSGQFPHRHGFWNNFTDLKFPAEQVSLFRRLQDAGYITAKIGKYHLFNLESGEDHADFRPYYDQLGLDWAQELPTPYMGPYLQNEYTRFLQAEGKLGAYIDDIAERFAIGDHLVVRPSPLTPDQHIDGYVASQSIAYMDSCPKDRPMFMCVSFPGPHTPFDAPEPYASQYAPEAMKLAPNVPADGGRGCDRAHIQRMQANYYGKLSHLDDRVGELVQALQRRGTADNALILFAADHGEYLGSHGRFGKGNFEEESARVPMLLSWPGRVQTNFECPALVSWLDIYATLIHAATGSESQEACQQSLLPLANGSCQTTHDAVFSEIGSGRGFLNYMVRQGEHKWFITNGSESLFHLASDPYEMQNLIQEESFQGLRHELKERLLDFLLTDQTNHAAGYKPLFQRMGLQTSGQKDVFGFLRRKFRDVHGL